MVRRWLLVVPLLLLAACSSPGPSTTGVVEVTDGTPRIVQSSDAYYEGMALLTPATRVLDAEGDPVDASVLVAGTEVEVWVDERTGCAESSPVQCRVETVRLTS
ncbi:hypothetical protein [Cellulomonas massiliensis]|uniref:hypothetical protein n=1 Tax=Cellulomonas massiliensis TaxID=1465811 RepID=UPI0002D3D4C0|nr:hypothetical protein [Cellulomonas massiliensis]